MPMLSQGEISAGLRASKDILPVLYGSSFSSNALLVKDFLMLEVLLLEEDLCEDCKLAVDVLDPLRKEE